MNSLASMAKKVPSWSKEFDTLIRAIGECKSKAEEDAIISKEVELLKPRLKDPKLDKRSMKELLVRLIYVEMLGHDASWAHVKALQACSDPNMLTKKVAYLSSSLFLDHRSETIILLVNTLQSDLKSDNYLIGERGWMRCARSGGGGGRGGARHRCRGGAATAPRIARRRSRSSRD